ncbi:GntR family transcriptional regulator [Agrococcus sp. KRD186]|uniref:GntR family transcriptional regulator n=1 Tax=Agrococcus sp. KRD186 TaxID=2729730 RepID=UPI0019D0CDDA|nr:GntR family transcriptional regulator [Agrococcus sp. KRD186]
MDDRGRRRDQGGSTYEQIRALIVERRLEPGTPLSAPELAEQLGVSRTPVREAIGTLVVEGLAVRRGTNRTMVAPVSVEELDHVYDVRARLEGLIASDAARRVTQSDVVTLEQQILLMDRLRDDYTQVVRFGAEFHDELQRISGNDLAVNLLRIVRGHVDRYRALTSQRPGRASDAADEHRAIFDAVAARDPERAEAVMREHLAAAKAVAISLMLEAHAAD